MKKRSIQEFLASRTEGRNLGGSYATEAHDAYGIISDLFFTGGKYQIITSKEQSKKGQMRVSFEYFDDPVVFNRELVPLAEALMNGTDFPRLLPTDDED